MRLVPAASIAAAVAITRVFASPDAADVMLTILGLVAGVADGGFSYDYDDLCAQCGFGPDAASARTRFDKANRAFRTGFDMWFGGAETRPCIRQRAEGDAGDDGPDPSDAVMAFDLEEAFVDLLRNPIGAAPRREACVPDAGTAAWIDAMSAASAAGASLHLGLRCGDGDCDALDLCAMLAAAGLDVAYAGKEVGDMPLVVLRRELHRGSDHGVLVVDGARLCTDGGCDDGDEASGSGRPADLVATSDALRLRDAADALQGLYVWRMPVSGRLPHALDGVVGGCIGPVALDPSWSRFVLGAAIPGIGPSGLDEILSRMPDPRKSDAVAATVRAVAAGTGRPLDEAAAFVARSLGPAGPGTLALTCAPPPDYDAGLLVADHDGVELLEAAARLRRIGGARILLWGPPGGGKSTFAHEICRRMAASDGPGGLTETATRVLVMTAAELLVGAYGGSERLLARGFAMAAAIGGVGGPAPILIDELDSFCGVRTDVGGGNGYLVRSLTNAFLREMDARPSVPIVATCNDPSAIDPAALRRFLWVIRIPADLPPALEGRAWASMLGMAPPADWTPIGAAVADFAVARTRCRLLGRVDARSHADAVERARDARTSGADSGGRRSRSVH